MNDNFNPVEVRRGDAAIILAMPHSGTQLPSDIFATLNDEGRTLRDADWHVDRLYEALFPGATIIAARFHRYVVDANRDPSGVSLYPGQNTTALVPLTNFDGAPIWRVEPNAAEIARRLTGFHAPYHAALRAEIERVKARHGVAVLYDCHSIRTHIPFLFEGALPDLNIGTNGGATAAPAIEEAVRTACAASAFTYVVNGRFRGGWTTRHYGRPEAGVHAIQMELSQARYLASEAPPFDYDAGRAEKLRAVLREALTSISAAAEKLKKEARP